MDGIDYPICTGRIDDVGPDYSCLGRVLDHPTEPWSEAYNYQLALTKIVMCSGRQHGIYDPAWEVIVPRLGFWLGRDH